MVSARLEIEPAACGPNGVTGDDAGPAACRFRRFHILPGERKLLRDGRPVELGSRAFDLLLVLLASRGRLVTKDQIVKHVWPSTMVEESNLRFQMASLRQALGGDRDVIKTIPGRGYLLAAEDDIPYGRDVPTAGPPVTPVISETTLLSSSRPSQRPMIAVIDDDDDTREALQSLLRSAGLRVETYSSVRDFLSSGCQSELGCLVLDVWLPDRTGLEFQADLAKMGVVVPIIFMSGHADVHMSVQAMKAGAIEFLTKPVRHQELLEAIQVAIAPLPRPALAQE